MGRNIFGPRERIWVDKRCFDPNEKKHKARKNLAAKYTCIHV